MASPLSPQQIAILKASPYVASVTARQISFTAQFKQRFYEEYTAGRKPCDILTRMGIDPGALGGPRIAGIRVHALEQGRSGYGLPDRRAQWQPGASHGRAKTSAEKIARLEHELAYTRRELEFIKKMISADRKANRRRSWEENRTSNTESSEK